MSHFEHIVQIKDAFHSGGDKVSRLGMIKHWYFKDGTISPDDFKWLIEQVEKTIEYTETLNETRRKRDEVKVKLEVALKTIKEQKQVIKQQQEELDAWRKEGMI